MNGSDLTRLQRVAGYSALKTADKRLKYDFVLKRFEERIANSAENKEKVIKKIAKLML
jgi:hypothetical protein